MTNNNPNINNTPSRPNAGLYRQGAANSPYECRQPGTSIKDETPGLPTKADAVLQAAQRTAAKPKSKTTAPPGKGKTRKPTDSEVNQMDVDTELPPAAPETLFRNQEDMVPDSEPDETMLDALAVGYFEEDNNNGAEHNREPPLIDEIDQEPRQTDPISPTLTPEETPEVGERTTTDKRTEPHREEEQPPPPSPNPPATINTMTNTNARPSTPQYEDAFLAQRDEISITTGNAITSITPQPQIPNKPTPNTNTPANQSPHDTPSANDKDNQTVQKDKKIEMLKALMDDLEACHSSNQTDPSNQGYWEKLREMLQTHAPSAKQPETNTLQPTTANQIVIDTTGSAEAHHQFNTSTNTANSMADGATANNNAPPPNITNTYYTEHNTINNSNNHNSYITPTPSTAAPNDNAMGYKVTIDNSFAMDLNDVLRRAEEPEDNPTYGPSAPRTPAFTPVQIFPATPAIDYPFDALPDPRKKFNLPAYTHRFLYKGPRILVFEATRFRQQIAEQLCHQINVTKEEAVFIVDNPTRINKSDYVDIVCNSTATFKEVSKAKLTFNNYDLTLHKSGAPLMEEQIFIRFSGMNISFNHKHLCEYLVTHFGKVMRIEALWIMKREEEFAGISFALATMKTNTFPASNLPAWINVKG
ncbi:uncharacterized protein UTRI_06334 [Ustilago trichophora]|uniref:Uncharacterized protein n=1 Tax=Ustilago trichophora TaxID=86804 RepID=A0A5C3EIC1_9BASI|nr:uncharacterized protein UTRI_06334 [Ustilago trichophora]